MTFSNFCGLKTITQAVIKLHKVASNSRILMVAFPPEEQTKNLVNLELPVDTLPLQYSLVSRILPTGYTLLRDKC